jgi:hypothetical protein
LAIRVLAQHQEPEMIIAIIVILLILGTGGGYYGHAQWGPWAGGGIGLGTVLLILLICYLLGFLR